uniref:Uncharacterized protein n=1 Tax=Nelumbo nucifera TaxID=4432 RepID=A0A822Y2Y7_NELNU|nr:TPA_asm: hypothetical protein HUJ06_026889 [Nelumbo nucifera]
MKKKKEMNKVTELLKFHLSSLDFLTSSDGALPPCHLGSGLEKFPSLSIVFKAPRQT